MLKMERSSNFVMWVLVEQCRFRFSRWNVEEMCEIGEMWFVVCTKCCSGVCRLGGRGGLILLREFGYQKNC